MMFIALEIKNTRVIELSCFHFLTQCQIVGIHKFFNGFLYNGIVNDDGVEVNVFIAYMIVDYNLDVMLKSLRNKRRIFTFIITRYILGLYELTTAYTQKVF